MLHGTVNINGGTITGNQAPNGHGGGILLNATQIYYGQQQTGQKAPRIDFTLSGDALIGANTAKSGGGVAMLGGVTATMTGGIIGGKVFQDGTTVNGNTATDTSDNTGGGGVYLMGCSLDLTDSSQKGEPSTTTVPLSPTFTMSGGTVGYEIEPDSQWEPVQETQLGNAANSGGGIFVYKNATFNLEQNGVVGFDITEEQYNAGESQYHLATRRQPPLMREKAAASVCRMTALYSRCRVGRSPIIQIPRTWMAYWY